MRYQRRRRLGLTAGALLLAASAVAPLTPASGQPAGFGFTDGEWVGSFSYLGTADLGGVAVRYRATGTFGLVSSDGGTTGLWDMNLVTVVPGGVATATAGGASEGDGITEVALLFEELTVRDSTTGMAITLTADEIPDAGAGSLYADSTSCHALSGAWEIPFNGSVLAGDFVANRASTSSTMGSGWQRVQQSGLDLLGQIDEGEVPVDAIRAYLHDAEVVMGETTTRADRDQCNDGTYARFRTAALALGDSMISALGLQVDQLSNEELVEVMRMGVRSGAFLTAELEFPYNVELVKRMTKALTDDDLSAMEYWLPVALEFGRNDVAELLQNAIEDAR